MIIIILYAHSIRSNIVFNLIQLIRNANYASKQNKHAAANKQSYLKARPLLELFHYIVLSLAPTQYGLHTYIDSFDTNLFLDL